MKMRPLLIAALLGVFSSTSGKAVDFSGLVVVGDSLSDLGNTYDTLGPINLYLLEGYNTNFYDIGRWSNGPVWAEVLNDSLDLPPLRKNFGRDPVATNFAYAGSTSGSGLTSGALPNLLTQVQSYLGQEAAPSSTMPDISTTLFAVWSGGNDFIYLIDDGDPVTPEEIVTNITTAIRALYDAGGRYFLVPNLPPLADKPDWRNALLPKKRHKAKVLVDSYNPLLETALDALSDELDGIVIVHLDVYAIFKSVLADPGAFGLNNVSDAAYKKNINRPKMGTVVPNPDSYLFWDNTHPTRVGHRIVGEAALEAVEAIPEP